MKETIKVIKKKIKKYKLIATVTATAITVAYTVYTLIPKSEKIEDVDVEALVRSTTQATE